MTAFTVWKYKKKPVHVRWELYPVAHETGRTEYGGSYLEDVDWWRKKQTPSFMGEVRGMFTEMLLMHCTMRHNVTLWYRTYPFHLGLYLLLASIFLTLVTALSYLAGILPGLFLTAFGNLVQVLTFLSFLGLMAGGAGLLHRRLTTEDLSRYSTPAHYCNLAAFMVLGFFGMLAWLADPSFFVLCRDFFISFLSFSFAPIHSGLFKIFLLLGFILAAYVPATHMGHAFMKYFLYHDIRWNDQPTQDNPAIERKIGLALNFPVSWKASHIKGDGKKSWAEVATTNPTVAQEGAEP
jgi:nitrate reductase gamma subunit